MEDTRRQIDELEQELQAAEKLLDVRFTIIDNNGVFHARGRGCVLGHPRQSHQTNAVCRLGFCQACIDHCRYAMNAVGERQAGPFTHTCWKGLHEVVMPLHWRDVHVGNLYAGIWRAPVEGDAVAQRGLPEEFHQTRRQLPVLSPDRRDQLQQAMPLIAAGILSQLEHILVGSLKQNRRAAILLFLHRHFSDPVALEDLALELGLSSSRTSHVVREHCHRSFQELLLETRMNAAQALLQTSNLKVREIAKRVGVPNEYHFSRLFKRTFGLPPGKYRQHQRRR